MPVKSAFGKKKRKVKKKITRKIKKLPASLKKEAKKCNIRLTRKVGGKRVYKSEKMLKQQIKNKQKNKKSKIKKTRKSRFGKLEVSSRMRPVSSFRQTNRPLLIAPNGPSQPWLLPDETPAYSSAPSFGRRRNKGRKQTRKPRKSRKSRKSHEDDEEEMDFGRRLRQRVRMGTLAGKRVNPSGYLSTWHGFPRTPPPSWNPLLLQGGNNFRTGVNDPSLTNVGFGRRRRTRRV